MLNASETTKAAIDAVNRGDHQRASELLIRVITVQPDNEQAWLWLSAIVATTEEKRYCLEIIRDLNPQNFHAKVGLAKLGVGAARRPVELTRTESHYISTALPKKSTHPSPSQVYPSREYKEPIDDAYPSSVILFRIILLTIIIAILSILWLFHENILRLFMHIMKI